MRRAFTALLVTVVVTVLLVNFKARPALTIGAASAPKPIAASPPSGGRSNPTAPQKSPAATAKPATPKTVVGPAVNTQYGPVQVAATVSGSKLQAVKAVVLPSGDGRTDEISAQAGPLLQQEAMTAQSAQIDTISGASYTSDGYRQSLQAALDRAFA
jgi:uncharacterized protein with FMN-binding domain